MDLMYKLARKNHLTIVGDPDQSIYGFRYAEANNIVRMRLHYERRGIPVKQVKLNQNYRSTVNILDFSEKMMAGSYNPNREEKKLQSNLAPEFNAPIFLTTAYNAADEAKQIADDITRLVKIEERYSYSDIAVLIRLTKQSRAFQKAFAKAGIPCRVVKGSSFWELAEIKLAVSYLRAICSNFDWIGYRTVLLSLDGFGQKIANSLDENIQKLYEENGEVNVYDYIKNMANNKTSLGKTLQKFLNVVEQSRGFLLVDEHYDAEAGCASKIPIQDRLCSMFDFILSTEKICDKIAMKKGGTRNKRPETFNDIHGEIESNLEELKQQLIYFDPLENTLFREFSQKADMNTQTSDNDSNANNSLPSPATSLTDDDIQIDEVLSTPMKPCSATVIGYNIDSDSDSDIEEISPFEFTIKKPSKVLSEIDSADQVW
ncbi:unnamed protein product [Ambrosiozyma monospora]|uniref:DNA 3'-5' helicase n=1 Tax=Ambrosiozyma monospora TaxID=43982 RepID=A0A9W6WB36_AMBMO|nr:unnamed protein product [Ambrosiozyma monospora]